MHCRTFFLERFPFLWFLSSPFYITVSSRISFLVFQVFKLFSQLYGSNWQSIQSPDIVPLLAFFFFHFVTLTAQWCLIDCLYDRGNNRTSTTKALCFYSFIKKKKKKKEVFDHWKSQKFSNKCSPNRQCLLHVLFKLCESPSWTKK